MSFNSPFTGNVVQPTDVSYRYIALTATTQLSWPINGSATDDYAARIMEVSASSSGLELWMPPANQASVGQDALIRNVGANTFTVKSYGGAGTVISVVAGKSEYIYITTNATAAGTWGIIDFGAGTSSADASTLAGYGLVASGTTLNQSHPTAAVVSGYVFTAADRAKSYVWTGGAGSATLPLASVAGDNWFILFKNNGSGTITVSTSSGQLFDGSTTKSFAPGESAFVVCTGTGYISVGYGQSTLFSFNVLTKPVTGGAYTLTASEASNTIQIYTGTLSSNVTVTYPQVANLYVVSNQTSAFGYTLTITTGVVGGANAVVPSGGQATLVTDGVNFYNANTVQSGATTVQLQNGSVGSPSLSFSSETNTGVYRPGAGIIGMTVLGNLIASVNSSGIAVTGSGNFTGGVSGGTF